MNDVEFFIRKKILKEKDDFFHQDLINYQDNLKNAIDSKKALIIGGAGTIGSSYIKQLLKYKPSKIVVVDHNENGLTELVRDLRSGKLLDYNPEFITYPVNLNSSIFEKIYFSDKFNIVANFSALKHVRSEKDEISIEAIFENNIFGAIKLMKIFESNPPDYFFSVSTDKAAESTNVMGASKALMEKIILSNRNTTRSTTARFANVAFSNGSLLFGYLNRISKLQPLSCPNDIKRFFVSPEQSGQICLLSTFLGNTKDIFFPKFDFNLDQIYFEKITLDFLSYLGYNPIICNSELEAKSIEITKKSSNYPVYFFKTDTVGEKHFEEFYNKEDVYNLDKYDSLGVIKSDSNLDYHQLESELKNFFNQKDFLKKDLIKLLQNYVPNFNHVGGSRHLDQKM